MFPGLAGFLDFLPGVDSETSRKRQDKDTGKISPVTMTTRGMIRALVLTQLDHRLFDNPADRDLLVRDGVHWYARSYESWHWWDFRMFMSRPTMTRAFQDLAAAGYVMRRKQTDFVTSDMPLAEQNAVKKVMHVYNGLAWAIDYQKLEADMASNATTQAYFLTVGPKHVLSLSGKSSDQADQTDAGSDQPDQTPRISLIRQCDQPDQTSAISLIRLSDQADQRSAESIQTPDQIQTEPSAAADEPDSRTGAEENKRTTVQPPAAPAGFTPDPLYMRLDNAQRITYSKLTTLHVDPAKAADIVQRCDPNQIEAWFEYIHRANAPGSGLVEVKNPGGFLIKVLAHPDSWPRPEKKPATPAQKYLGGTLGSDIKH